MPRSKQPKSRNYAREMEAYMQQRMQKINRDIQDNLNTQGAPMDSNSYINIDWRAAGIVTDAEVARPRPAAEPKMAPSAFKRGDLVTIRRGKRVWRIHHFEEWPDLARNRMVRLAYLESDSGDRTREVEQDLELFVAPKVVKKLPTKAKIDFDSVVIADHKRQQILEALEQVNQFELIFEKWGFGETVEKGKGISMLFYGPPGTGKTLMGQAIANKLKSKLKVIATADIESSAPGEAERNIRKCFQEAKESKDILLFDECDSLIYTRQNVGPIMGAQVNELLSQIERFDGITIFTTNRLGTLDEAVNRRLALKLEFDMPSTAERAQIWQRMFPKKAPLDKKIDWERLAIVEISGGYIKNAVLRAARMAATEDMPDKKKKITMNHLVEALKLETQSMIEFEDAKAAHDRSYGRVTGPMGLDSSGRKVIHQVEATSSGHAAANN